MGREDIGRRSDHTNIARMFNDVGTYMISQQAV